MRVIDWIDYDDSNYERYKSNSVADWENVRAIIIDEVRKNGYHFDGNYHQNGEYGTPLLDNGKKVCMTQRVWGGIIADAFPEEFDNPNDQYNYVIWYLGAGIPDDRWKFPKEDN